MKKVQRNEIIDYQTYSDQRSQYQGQISAQKSDRRIHVGDYLTFLFENHDTIWYQIQEMIRVEKIVREKEIEHEIKTYNGLLGDSGELGCSLLIEIDDPEERKVKLKQWLELPKHLYVQLEEGQKIYAEYDSGQIGTDRLSSVQYLKFKTQGKTPIAIGSDHPQLRVEIPLSEAQKKALAQDLEND